MLNAQVFVNLPLKFGVGMNLVRYGNFLSEGSDQKGFRFNSSGYRLLSRSRYCACAGFLITTPGLLHDPSFGVDFILKRGIRRLPLRGFAAQLTV